MTTTQKHRNFIGEPMGIKDITAIAGIGNVNATKLKECGFEKAYHLLGQFLILKKDQEKFVDYLRKEIGVANGYATTAYKCLYEWSLNFI